MSATSAGGQAGGQRARRWLVLAAGTVALTAGSAFQYGLAYLIPALRMRAPGSFRRKTND